MSYPLFQIDLVTPTSSIGKTSMCWAFGDGNYTCSGFNATSLLYACPSSMCDQWIHVLLNYMYYIDLFYYGIFSMCCPFQQRKLWSLKLQHNIIVWCTTIIQALLMGDIITYHVFLNSLTTPISFIRVVSTTNCSSKRNYVRSGFDATSSLDVCPSSMCV